MTEKNLMIHLLEGKKIGSNEWSKEEFIRLQDTKIIDERGDEYGILTVINDWNLDEFYLWQEEEKPVSYDILREIKEVKQLLIDIWNWR